MVAFNLAITEYNKLDPEGAKGDTLWNGLEVLS